ncbi:MAG TPA: alpha/beta hydrolase family protein [Pyrinomonadaceae bacterium]|nr:alpha/beta hydrolase family protein [Pyrinomonadaceae bacterium]
MSDLIDGVFHSSLIQKNVRYRVLVPHFVSESVEPIPVLYLLHGLFGSCENWTELTDLRSYVGEAKLMIVMPDGGDNWYTDSEEKYESYLIHDLMLEMENRFGASSKRDKRAIAGNSMGGYGALKLALKYPLVFDFAASFSGAFHATRLLGHSVDGELIPSISRVFGDGQSRVRIDNDIFALAARAAGNVDRLPGIYFDCGIDDEFIAANREFSSALTAAGIEHEFLEIDGGHDWPYWDDRIRYLVSILKHRFSV